MPIFRGWVSKRNSLKSLKLKKKLEEDGLIEGRRRENLKKKAVVSSIQCYWEIP